MSHLLKALEELRFDESVLINTDTLGKFPPILKITIQKITIQKGRLLFTVSRSFKEIHQCNLGFEYLIASDIENGLKQLREGPDSA